MFGYVVTYCNTQSSSGTGARGLPRRCQNGDVIPRQRAPRRVALGWESSGVRGCPGAASEDCEKPLAKVSQGFFVIRDASLAIRPDYPLFTHSPSGNRHPPGIDDRRRHGAGNVANTTLSVANDAPGAIAEAEAANTRIGRVTLAPRSARERPPHVRCGAGGATPRPRRIPAPIARRGARGRESRPPTDGGRRGMPRTPERRGYDFGTTASK